MNNAITYSQSGVNIDNGNEFVNQIKPLSKKTARPWAGAQLGGFGAVFDPKMAGFKDPLIFTSTDGVGTKLAIAINHKKLDTIGIDLVAMCVNDLLAEGAKPLAFLDYYACGTLKIPNAVAVMQGIVAGCIQAECALIGGETAEMPEFYSNDKFDLAGFVVGAMERKKYMKRPKPRAGDILLALPSSGFHSNGYSLVRKIMAVKNLQLTDKWGAGTLGDALLTPTHIYTQPAMLAFGQNLAKIACHITGGGLPENLPRVFGDELLAKIDINAWQIPDIFTYFQQMGNIPLDDFWRTFNCGVGMVFVCDKKKAPILQDIWRKNGQNSFVLGQLADNKGQTHHRVLL